MNVLLRKVLCTEFCFQPRWSNRAQIYTPASKDQNNMKNYETMFQTLNNRQLRTVIPGRGETHETSPSVAPVY